MRNPWLDLPTKRPFVLPIDKPYVDAHNKNLTGLTSKTSREMARIHLTAIPEPFSGRRDAPVVILLANPKHETKPKQRLSKAQRDRIREGLTAPKGQPFFAIHDEFKGTGAHKWWYPKLRDLCDEVGTDVVANNIQVIELHGYHSLSFRPPVRNFPSQQYQFYLVEQAIKRGAVIVIPWAIKHWHASMPELKDKKYLSQYGCEVVLGTYPFRKAGLTQNLLERGGYSKVLKRLKAQAAL